MKIAVTYDNGEVFPHFGRTEAFKIYDVEDDEILSSEVMNTNGVGHEALAGLLAEHDIDVLICGGMGAGAQAALSASGIEVVSGASGDVDVAVKAYLRDELVSAGVNCDHHDHDREAEDGDEGFDYENYDFGAVDHDGYDGDDGYDGCGCDGSCGGCGGYDGEGGGCGGCGGGCHGAPQIMLEGPNAGKTVRVHYRGTFNDGTQFDSSYDRGEPLEFVCGAGMMIKGFDKAVVNMEVGQIVDVHLMPEEAYGMRDPSMIFTVDVAEMPGAEDLKAGDQAYLADMYGRPFPVLISAKDDKTITFDANHEMAGKELNFRIELVEVK